MKVCFIGYGSIARRHVRNLIEICDKRQIELTIDLCRSGKGRVLEQEEQTGIHKVYSGIDEIPDVYDIVFITNPTRYHLETLIQVQDKAKYFFIEKPIFHKSDIDFKELDSLKQKVCYVACPLRYTSVLQYLKKNIDFTQIYSVRCISSSYLPNWRKGVDYRNTYSAHKDQGGGVAIDLIHEWDYITWLLGMPEQVFHVVGRFSHLELDSEDLAIYIARYRDKSVELHLDYFGRKTIRQIELYGAEDTIIGDLVSGEVRYLKSGEIVRLLEERDDYQKRELETFLNIVIGKESNSNNIENACRVLALAKGEQK